VFKKLICAMDFSPLSLKAASASADLARSLNAKLILVHVITPGAEYGSLGLPKDNLRPALENKLREVCGSVGTDVDWGIVDGDPAAELVTFAQRWGGDLIAIGSHGRTGLGRVLLGSVTSHLVRNAKVPVLVVGPETT
jgi:nucleotide-binding universal stress UspA family protein